MSTDFLRTTLFNDYALTIPTDYTNVKSIYDYIKSHGGIILSFRAACKENKLYIVEILKNHSLIDESILLTQLSLAIENDKDDLLQTLLQSNSYDPENSVDLLIKSIEFYDSTKPNSSSVIIKRIIDSGIPIDEDNNVLSYVVFYNAYIILEYIMEKYPDLNYGQNDSKYLRTASKFGFTKIVDLLLGQPTVNPNAKQTKSLINAIKGEHVEIVRLLLLDNKVDTTRINILYDDYVKNSKILELLLSNSDFNPYLSKAILNIKNIPEQSRLLLYNDPRVPIDRYTIEKLKPRIIDIEKYTDKIIEVFLSNWGVEDAKYPRYEMLKILATNNFLDDLDIQIVNIPEFIVFCRYDNKMLYNQLNQREVPYMDCFTRFNCIVLLTWLVTKNNVCFFSLISSIPIYIKNQLLQWSTQVFEEPIQR